MFKCKGLTEDNHCIAHPELGILRGNPKFICDECKKKGFGPCKYIERKEKRDELCGCYWIVCHNPESPICGDERVWYDKKCNQHHCNFFAK